MITKQQLSAYPTCARAVAYTELVICTPQSEPYCCWDLLTSKPLSPDEILRLIKLTVESYAYEEPWARETLAQMGTPEYKQYLAAKLGMM